MKYQEFLVQLKQNKIAPVYFFTGEEDFLKREALQTLYKLLVHEEQKDFNYSLLYGKDTTAGDILAQAEALPFLAERRLVVVREIEKLSGRDELEDYLDKPNPSTCLVLLTADYDAKKQRTEFFKKLKKFEVVFWPLYANELKAWVAARFKEQDQSIGTDAVDLLISKVGTNMANLHSEIQKLLINLKGRSKVTAADLKSQLFRLYTDEGWQLERILGRKEVTPALVAVQDLLREKKDSSYILGVMAGAWRKLIVAKEMQHNNASSAEIMARAWVKTFDDQRNFSASLQQFELPELLSKYKKIAETDLAIKSGKKDPLWALENLIIELCR